MLQGHIRITMATAQIAIILTCSLLVTGLQPNTVPQGKSSKRDDIFSLGDDVHEPDLLKDSTKEPITDTKAAFPVLDAFKTNPTLTADDLKDQVEFENSDGYGIHEAVREAIENLHKRTTKETVSKKKPADATSKKSTEAHIDARKIIDAVVRQELSHYNVKTANSPIENPSARSPKMDSSIHSKLEQISIAEQKLFALISEMKNFLTKKEHSSVRQHEASSLLNDNFEGIENVLLNKENVKRNFIPNSKLPNLQEFRRNSSLVDKFIDDAIPNDDDDDDDDDDEDDALEDGKDNEQSMKGDVRDLLGKKEMKHALLKNAATGEIDDVPLSKLEQESEDNDSVASDRGITRDNLVESPFSSLDYKKTGKTFKHMLS